MSKEVASFLKWKDIEHEVYRTYVFPSGKTVTIDRPVKLNVSGSNGHRILDANNVSHYIPSGWIHIYWETDDNVAISF